MTTVVLESLGCKLNQAETEALARSLENTGYRVCRDGPADVYIVNTCTVTHVADRKTRQALRAARRSNPGACIIAAGCYAERARHELAGIADIVVGNRGKDRLAELLEARMHATSGALEASPGELRTRSLIKVQEGCTQYCTFCIVPHTRGPEKSVPSSDVLREISDRVREGYREFVLTGTRLGACGKDSGGPSLPQLVRMVLEIEGVERLRLSSLAPSDLTAELIDLWQDARLCPHLHIPLQSGSQAVLERMNREYSLEEFEQSVAYARACIPDLAVTTDVIVGFPGETDAEFEQSYRFCQMQGFAGIHVFPYSRRSGTPAASRIDQVADGKKKMRARSMLDLAASSAQKFRRRFVGKTMNVLWESNQGKIWSGLAPSYIRVFAESQRDLRNQIVPVRLESEAKWGLVGTLPGEE